MGGYKKLTKEEVGEELGVLNDEKDVDYSKNMTMSKEGLAYLDKTLALCEENDVKVYLIRSPLHSKYPGFKNEEFYQQVLKSRYADLELLDFKDFPLEDLEYADLQHLNYRGAKKFSLFFDDILKKGLLESGNKQDFINKEMARISE